MQMSDLNAVINEINAANKQKKLSPDQLTNLIDTAGKIDNVVFTELKVKTWRDVGTKKFGIRGEKAVMELKKLFNQYMTPPTRHDADLMNRMLPPMTADEILGKKSVEPGRFQSVTPNESALPSVTLEAMCICPEDYGIIREWDCPKHGHVASKKPNPLEN